MTKRAVITLAIGYQPFWGLTHPLMERYAQRIGADFVVIDQSQKSSNLTEGYKLEKFQLKYYLEQYDRVIFLDSDIAIHPQCPNLFDLVEQQELGAVCECLPYFNREGIFQEAAQFYGVPYPGNDQQWFNTGMMVLSHHHRQLFNEPLNIKTFNARNMDGSIAPERFTWLDMPLLNCLRIACKIPLHNLGYSFNYLSPLTRIPSPPGPAENAWIYHSSGEDKSCLNRMIDRWYPKGSLSEKAQPIA